VSGAGTTLGQRISRVAVLGGSPHQLTLSQFSIICAVRKTSFPSSQLHIYSAICRAHITEYYLCTIRPRVIHPNKWCKLVPWLVWTGVIRHEMRKNCPWVISITR